VPYSQTAWWTDPLGVYRQDCSGYVSMAWHLDQNVNFWTGNLAAVSHPISQQELQPGDILLNPSTHTLIFAGWDDATHATFSLYEESRPGTDAQYVSGAHYAAYANNGFFPYRYDLLDHGDGGSAEFAVLPPYPTAPTALPAPPLLAWTDGGGHVSSVPAAPAHTWQPAPSVAAIGQKKSLAGSTVENDTPMAVEYLIGGLVACAWVVQRRRNRSTARHAPAHAMPRGNATKTSDDNTRDKQAQLTPTLRHRRDKSPHTGRHR
jgi:hypothetical protein